MEFMAIEEARTALDLAKTISEQVDECVCYTLSLKQAEIVALALFMVAIQSGHATWTTPSVRGLVI